MPTVKRFEELQIWQLAREQASAVFQLIHSTPLREDEALARQINAASGSVMDNIAEGSDRFSRAEFKQFLVIARGPNAETKSQLYRIQDRGYIALATADALQSASKELGIKISSLLRHIQNTIRNLFYPRGRCQNPPLATIHIVSKGSTTISTKNLIECICSIVR